MVLKECPYCHRLFTAELVSEEQVDSSEVTRQGDVVDIELGKVEGAGGRPESGTPLIKSQVNVERIADHPEAYVTSKLTYKCKHCGKEWTKLSVKEVGIPKEYVADEEEKTEYDAEEEEEEAREEQYARE